MSATVSGKPRKSEQTDILKQRLGRLPLLVMGLLAMACGIWGGLIRLPLNLPLPSDNANWITFHGPLMVGGFLGTVIGLERGVGLRRWWAYLAPVLTGVAALLLVLGQTSRVPVILMVLGSAVYSLVSWRVVMMQKVLFTTLMALGGMAWLAGNIFWLADWPFNRVVPWWIAFLVLTIVGERLDLSRFQKPSKWSNPLLWGALVAFAGGVILSAIVQGPGEKLAGIGLVALALWLGRFDIARRTIRQPGLPRFMAICLLVGYLWLALAGVLMFLAAPMFTGFKYDATLHAFFLGFVFSMIIGHAPVIFPAVLSLPPVFRRTSYVPLIVLHASLLLRVVGDLTDWFPGRLWGGKFNSIAVALFVLNVVLSFALARISLPVAFRRSVGQNRPGKNVNKSTKPAHETPDRISLVRSPAEARLP